MEIAKRKKISVELNIAPLIDIVFLLLIFFMLTSTFMKEKAVELGLPESDSTVAAKQDLIRITALDSDSFVINGTKVTTQGLQEMLEEIHQVTPELGTLLRIDKESDVQLLISTMDLIKGAGFTDVSLSADQLSDSEAP